MGLFSKRTAKNATQKATNLDLETICKIIDLELPKKYKDYRHCTFTKVAMRVQDIEPGCLFFCNWFYKAKEVGLEKIQKEAEFVITPVAIRGCKNIVCDHTKGRALKLMNYIRNQHDMKVVTVTGSVGKTSCKDMIASVLEQKYGDTLTASIGNGNTYYLVSKTIQDLKDDTKVLLQEVGAGSESPKTMQSAASILEADIMVYTNIRDNHIDTYGSREAIAEEKFSLSDFGNQQGTVIVNYDDDILRTHTFPQKTLYYALQNPEADYYAKDIALTDKETTFTLVDRKEGKELPVTVEHVGEQHVLNALVGYIVGKLLDETDADILEGIRQFKTQGVRQNIIDLGKYKLLADCHNSSYDSIEMILKSFDNMKPRRQGRKIVVLGDILELGDRSEGIHRNVGKLLAEYDFDEVVFQGQEMRFAYEEYCKSKSNGQYFESRDDLMRAITDMVKKDDFLLFKASHAMLFAEMLDTLFGTDVGESSARGHKSYKARKNDQFNYNIFEEHATIVKYTGTAKTVVIPDELDGFPVEKLGKEAFAGTDVEEAVLPKHLVRLNNSCFKGSSVRKVVINSDLKQLGQSIFEDCAQLEEIELPRSLLLIGSGTFKGCKSLKRLFIGRNTRKFGKDVFAGCDQLVIECREGSRAHDYALKNNVQFKLV